MTLQKKHCSVRCTVDFEELAPLNIQHDKSELNDETEENIGRKKLRL